MTAKKKAKKRTPGRGGGRSSTPTPPSASASPPVLSPGTTIPEGKTIRITCEGAAMVPLREFQEYQGELKWLEAKQYEKLKMSILTDGFHDPIHIWRKPGDPKPRKLIDGHQRIRTIRQMTEQEGFTLEGGRLPVVWVVADTEKQAKRIILEKMSQYGKYDEDTLYQFISEAELDWPELKAMVEFPAIQMDKLEVGWFKDDDPAADDVPDPPKKAISKLGDLWVLGDHRLLCGDNTNIKNIEILMGNNKATVVFTDPPYNHASEDKGIAASVSRAHADLMASDWDRDFEFGAVSPSIDAMLACDSTAYICTSWHLAGSIWEWMARRSSHYSYCVWHKPNPMPSLMKRHWTWASELICYATFGRHYFLFPNGTHLPNVWSIPKSSDGSHPTQKPVELPAHALRHSSPEGAIVCDPFLGSGTTMIAAEKLNRRCYGIELEPRYVDVCVERWEQYSGKKAKRVKA